jgi:unsaturated rhamnogalacturonyl hydrolase
MTLAAVMRIRTALRDAMMVALLMFPLPASTARGQVPPTVRTRVVLLDCYYNNEWKTDEAGNTVRFHYIWSDTANSGFSILGDILTRSGARIDTLCRAPSRAALQRASIYLIVDPDTPLETRAPNYIQPADITLIAQWVREGGILVLMGNDRGNAEFVHLNALAAIFGITFNEDSRNRVVGRDFAAGTFDRFPVHPLFAGVRRIFIKELSTLCVKKPAEAVLSEGGDVIMAFSKYGKGAVFAVGDPWFYNEYMDERRLPPGYDNPKAAGNLFRWLLGIAGRGS